MHHFDETVLLCHRRHEVLVRLRSFFHPLPVCVAQHSLHCFHEAPLGNRLEYFRPEHPPSNAKPATNPRLGLAFSLCDVRSNPMLTEMIQHCPACALVAHFCATQIFLSIFHLSADQYNDTVRNCKFCRLLLSVGPQLNALFFIFWGEAGDTHTKGGLPAGRCAQAQV